MVSPEVIIVQAINALANEISLKRVKIELQLKAIHDKEMELDEVLFQKVFINLLHMVIFKSPQNDQPITIIAELVQ